jgi:hypothetical protein
MRRRLRIKYQGLRIISTFSLEITESGQGFQDPWVQGFGK